MTPLRFRKAKSITADSNRTLTAPPILHEFAVEHVGLVAGAEANEVAAAADADDVGFGRIALAERADEFEAVLARPLFYSRARLESSVVCDCRRLLQLNLFTRPPVTPFIFANAFRTSRSLADPRSPANG